MRKISIPLPQKITFSQTCCGTEKKSFLTMLPLYSMTSVRKTSKNNLPKNGKRKRHMPGKPISYPCRWTGSKNLKKFAGLTKRVNLIQNLLITKELPLLLVPGFLVLIVPAFIIKARLFLKRN